jgi:hypothetical protein
VGDDEVPRIWMLRVSGADELGEADAGLQTRCMRVRASPQKLSERDVCQSAFELAPQ